MKQPENNEIDTLLRGWASNERSRSAKTSENVAGSHLDADELNSYAEGVLPVAARARYTAHLVDCDECRRLVAELTEAKPLPAGDRVVDLNRSWRARLAGFFSPSVLKYAVPSLAVLVIAVVFFATRQPEPRSSVALNTATSPASPSPSSSQVTGADRVSPQATTSAATEKTVAAPSRSPQDQPAQKKEDARTRADAADNEEQTKQNAVAAADEAEASRRGQADSKEKRPAPATETVVVAPPPEAPAPVAKVAGNAPKEAAAARDEINGNRERGGPSKGEAASKNSAGRGQDKTEVRSLSALQPGTDQQRTVAGRKFKREDGKWIDLGYKSSMAVTTLARGSEQFRALVADEPEIEAISKQLSGEVIVVWKGRAYHIN